MLMGGDSCSNPSTRWLIFTFISYKMLMLWICLGHFLRTRWRQYRRLYKARSLQTLRTSWKPDWSRPCLFAWSRPRSEGRPRRWSSDELWRSGPWEDRPSVSCGLAGHHKGLEMSSKTLDQPQRSGCPSHRFNLKCYERIMLRFLKLGPVTTSFRTQLQNQTDY